MIIFTPIKDLPCEYLEMKNVRQVVKYNLSAYYLDIQALNSLIPSTESIGEKVIRGEDSDAEFDMMYQNYIFTNNIAFDQFMSLIIPVYMNPDVLVQVLITESNLRDIITEALIKLIQARYGYNSYIVKDIEDFLYVEESTFSIPGLFNISKDLEIWYGLHMNDIAAEEAKYE